MRKKTLRAFLAYIIAGIVAGACGQNDSDRGHSTGSLLYGELTNMKVEVRRVRLRDPISVRQAGEVVRTSEIVEFEVSAAEPILARALDPVLVVGPRVVIEYGYERQNTLVFVEPRPELLPAEARIAFRWGESGSETELSMYRADTVPLIER